MTTRKLIRFSDSTIQKAMCARSPEDVEISFGKTYHRDYKSFLYKHLEVRYFYGHDFDEIEVFFLGDQTKKLFVAESTLIDDFNNHQVRTSSSLDRKNHSGTFVKNLRNLLEKNRKSEIRIFEI